MVVKGFHPVFISFFKRLCGRNEDHLDEQLAEDQPEVDVLDVGRLKQHVGQVHRESGLKILKNMRLAW